MNSKKIVLAGLVVGVIFYALSLAIWWLFKFLPVVPTPVIILNQGLQVGWMVEHLVVSLFVGLLWGVGYMVCKGDYQYGVVIYVAGFLPTFVIQSVVFADVRMFMIYGAIVSLVAVLIADKVFSLIVKNRT